MGKDAYRTNDDKVGDGFSHDPLFRGIFRRASTSFFLFRIRQIGACRLTKDHEVAHVADRICLPPGIRVPERHELTNLRLHSGSLGLQRSRDAISRSQPILLLRWRWRRSAKELASGQEEEQQRWRHTTMQGVFVGSFRKTWKVMKLLEHRPLWRFLCSSSVADVVGVVSLYVEYSCGMLKFNT
jgi:hypothetical protein